MCLNFVSNQFNSITMFVLSLGLTVFADVCDAGFVCVSASNNSIPTDGVTGYECLPGYYCPKGSDQGVKCPEGTFSERYGLENVTECEPCTPGQYCQTQGKLRGILMIYSLKIFHGSQGLNCGHFVQ